MKDNPYLKYENKNGKCTYPFTPDPAGYCRSYAYHIDGTEGYDCMDAICKGCECNNPEGGCK